METQEFDHLCRTLPQGRTVFRYYKDRYSLQLLRYAVADGARVSALRAGPWARLLEKPRVRTLLAHCGGRLTPLLIDSADGDPGVVDYTLSLSRWQGQQTSRPGINLVLQLNFSRRHDGEYQRLLRPREGATPFACRAHPVARDGRHTLAWARIDLDPGSSEALIEEIQSDWVRYARRTWEGTRKHGDHWRLRLLEGGADGVADYCEGPLREHSQVWDEAMLSASLWLLRECLGVARVYYHTPESGQCLKRIGGDGPPRSLYTDLPRRFCFLETDQAPAFLQHQARTRKALGKVRLQRLDLPVAAQADRGDSHGA